MAWTSQAAAISWDGTGQQCPGLIVSHLKPRAFDIVIELKIEAPSKRPHGSQTVPDPNGAKSWECNVRLWKAFGVTVLLLHWLLTRRCLPLGSGKELSKKACQTAEQEHVGACEALQHMIAVSARTVLGLSCF